MAAVEPDLRSDQHARQRFATHLTGLLISRFTGDNVQRVAGDKPSRGLFFIGTVFPRADLRRRRPQRAAPTELGLEVLVPADTPDDAQLEVTVTGAFHYRVFPSFQEQTQPEISAITETDEEAPGEIREDQVPPTRLAEAVLKRVWKKAGPFHVTARISISRLPESGELVLLANDPLARQAHEVWHQDAEKYRSRKFESKTVVEQLAELRVPEHSLEDAVAFNKYLRDWYKGRIPEPKWAARVRLRVSRRRDSTRKVAVLLENACEEGKHPLDDVDNAIFETDVRVKSIGFAFTPFVLDRLRDDYRHSGRIPAVGINSVAETSGDGPLIDLHTRHAPALRRMRIRPKQFEAKIEDLSLDPLPLLESLAEQMHNQASGLRQQLELKRGVLTETGLNYFERDVTLFEDEFKRFLEGMRVLTEVPQALEAFRLTNKTFSSSSKDFRNWYRFQVIFLVCVIPDLVCPRFNAYAGKRDHVDVIYFPTGGGKTETYLSAVVFQMFFDRLMGKKSGVSAITRFPLRLLSLQQIQRIADIFGAAELIRRAHGTIGGIGYDAFSTGYFVGGDNTPNWLFKAPFEGEGGVDVLSTIASDPDRGERFKIVDRCPFCGAAEIRVVAARETVRLKLVCGRCNAELPIYLSDDEIYRYLPTFIVGTLDKMAVAGWRQHFRHLFGQVTHRCPDHGYLSGGRCLYSGRNNLCKRRSDEYIPVVLEDPTPSIMVQDEMHLVRESLGCYDSHYETYLDQLETAVTNGAKRPKIIAATATISDPSFQLRHLYMRRGAEFPARGPDLHNSFYYEEDSTEVARIIVGILPHNKTMLFAVLDLILQHARAVRSWMRDPSELIASGVFVSAEQAQRILTDYAIALSYNLMKMQGDAVSQSIKTMVNPALRGANLGEIRSQSLTGDVTFAQVRKVLGMLERRTVGEGLDLITATNMISHGVDVNSLNFMLFQGMPTSTAEYIQASSRVGRRYPGIVFVVFNAARERDASHYKYFPEYHELADLFVEPVPINRWAKFSVDRTLPGIFCAAIMDYFEPIAQRSGHTRLYMTDGFSSAINSGLITEDQIVEFVLKSYRVAEDDMGQYFEEVIRSTIREFVGALTAPAQSKFIANALPVQPLQSLRDTDVQVEISSTRESYEPMERVSATPPGAEEP